MNLKKKKIIITGGLGHIGSSLAEKLSISNAVTVIDNLLIDQNKKFDLDAKVNIIIGNASEKILEIENADIIFHFGEYSRVEQSMSEPELVFTNNFQSLIPVINHAKKLNAKFIYSASSTKFADNGEARITSPYAITKYLNSEIVRHYAKWCNLDYAIVYFNNVYGGRERGSGNYATLIAKFLELNKKNLPLTVTLPGNQRRAFTHIEDVVNALLLVTKFGHGDGYIICPDEDFSIEEVAKMISENIIYQDGNQANRMNGVIDNEKMKALGWEPKHNLKDFIESSKNK
jgi:UDP-glucose 4-epimerase